MNLITKIKNLMAGKAATLICLFAFSVTNADDTDIYLNTNATVTDKPMIMLSLDYRPNLANTVCSDSEDTAADGACGALVEETALLTEQSYLSGDSIRKNGNYSSLEVYIAILKKVMDHQLFVAGGTAVTIKDEAEFGIMMNHANSNNCEPGDEGCSNGGFILSGFQDLSTLAGWNNFFGALENVSLPGLSWNEVRNGNNACQQYGVNTGTHTYQGAELGFEFYRYLTGQGVYFGEQGYEDFGTDSTRNMNDPLELLAAPVSPSDATCRASPTWDPTIISGGNYISPLDDLDPSGCGADIYTFNFMFQVSSQEEDANCAIMQPVENQGMGLPGNQNNCSVNSSGNAGTFGEVLEFLNDEDLAPGPDGKQNVTSYFFVPENKVNQTTNSYASKGGTSNAIGMDLTDIDSTLSILQNLLGEVLDVSTTFVSPTLPANVFNRTDLLNQVYIAIFKADDDHLPRWTGNLKRFHLNTDDPSHPYITGATSTGGVDTSSAVDDMDGRIKSSTLSVWTHPEDVPAPPNALADYTEGHDGRSTTHGGAGGNMPGLRLNYDPGFTNNFTATTESSARRIFTEPDSRSSTTLRPFDADDSTAIAMLEIGDGTTTLTSLVDDYKQIKLDLWQTLMPYSDCSSYDAYANPTPANCDFYNEAPVADQTTGIARMKDILAYGRGYNDFSGVKRDWIMGDPLHSKPVTINYGGTTESNQIVRVAFSTNDGFIHFIRAEDGVEEWAFSPRSVTQTQHRLQANTLDTAPTHPYTLDGSPTVLQLDNNNDGIIDPLTDKVYLYIGMRRGGKHFYALDITNYETPELLWSINDQDTGFSELGQTWSEPQPIYVRYGPSGSEVEQMALIFGGGYNGDHAGDGIDVGKDERDETNSSFTGSDDDEGNAIYIVNAETGALIWKATGAGTGVTGPTGVETEYFHSEMVDSIPAKVLAVDSTIANDNIHDRAYVGDTGGVIWRVDFSSTDRSNWKVTKLANLGRHDISASQTEDRRFFHGIDFVPSIDSSGAFDGLVVASGNRANPLTDNTDNYLYMIKDRDTASDSTLFTPLAQSELIDFTSNCLQDGDATDCESSDGVGSVSDLENGWKIKLEQCTDESASGSCGEKGLSQPLVLFGNIIFNSYIPPLSQSADPEAAVCAPAEGNGQSYFINFQDGTAVQDLNTANSSGGNVVLDRSERLESGGIPSDPVVAGTFGETEVIGGEGSTGSGSGSGTGTGATCSESIGVLYPDLDIELLCSIGLMKKYWYTTEPE